MRTPTFKLSLDLFSRLNLNYLGRKKYSGRKG